MSGYQVQHEYTLVGNTHGSHLTNRLRNRLQFPSLHHGFPYTAAIPQYTQSQINTYYHQYQCYPPEPYQIIPDTYYAHTTSPGAYIDHGHPSLYPQYTQPGGSLQLPQASPRTWQCDVPNCTSTANFTRLADLQRHQSTVHGTRSPEFPCTVHGCSRVADKGFTRRDHLVEHQRNFHHLDIPKRKPGERSANPLGPPDFQ
ncbi:hypothetical protein BDV95DRAFT_594600 [Massariosphaeria phaeospora]|uniref:C2H2-type domain-containing protein n=1 Tax=Massariosphaeria phaeospora TaxID=100035 RepID=A0A7C8I9I7_9PLEO|nr:hypothetical protein BDV95DRAFT_594600 [Massariosphaeria phaeospora]